MRWTKVFLAAGFAFFASLGLPAQTAPAPPPSDAPLKQKYGAKLADFEEMTRREMAADRTTGLAIGLLEGGQTWIRAFGLSDVEDDSPMRTDSSFRAASVTKPMTAIAVLQLADQGKIDLDAEIQAYVPYFPRKPHRVTVRQLLGHLGGISHYKNPAAELHIKEHRTTREAIAIFQDFDLVAEPGTKYSYSTYGYNLLGAAIEGASGQSYGAYMREHVWAPAGMADTRLDDPREIIPHRVRGYTREDGKLKNSEFVDMSSRFAGGGTRTTVPDLLKFAAAFMDGKLLSKESVDAMTRSMVERDGHYTGYGLGWGVEPQNGRFLVSHSGGQNETRTLLFLLPGRHAAIAAATNFESGDLFWYVQALVFEVLGERWDRSGGSAAYLPGRVERAQFQAARDAFHWGLSAYEKNGRALTEDPGKLSEAFAFFDRCVNRSAIARDAAAVRQRCQDGVHPLSGEPIPIVGSSMAAALSARGVPVDHASGPAAFFWAYIELYRRSAAIPKNRRFSRAFEAQVARWARDWPRTFDESSRSPVSTSSWGLDAAKLRPKSAGASIYPDFSTELERAVFLYAVDGNREAALAAARLSREMYPDLARPAVTLAAAELCFGDAARARPLIQTARGLDGGEDATGPRRLNGFAYDLAEIGQVRAATALLRIALELHPRVANLYDSLGELEAMAGNTEAAIAAYRKALELDPTLESSATGLKNLEKPKS